MTADDARPDGEQSAMVAGPTATVTRPSPAAARRAGAAVVVSLVTAAAAVAVGVAALRRSVHRIEVVGWSMAPTLQPGDRLVVVRVPWSPTPWPSPGQIVALTDPREPRRVLVKRVGAIHVRDGTLEVAGDRPEASTDSRTFGPVPRSSIVGRAVYRYAPPGRRGALDRPEEYHRA
jgi:nickel-type superoxide dismutase maturation protease